MPARAVASASDRVPPIQIGVVGCGDVTETRHLPALRAVRGARVAALADVDAGRLGRVADRFHVPRRYADYADLVQDATVQAVAVCVPAFLHAEVALAALSAGKHVFVEKPMTLTSEDAERLVRRAADSPRCCTVGFNLRSHRLVEDARRLIASGALGEIELIRTGWTSGLPPERALPAWRRQRARGGGAVLEIAPHHVDLWRFLTGTEVESVFAQTRSQFLEDQTAVVTARLSTGALATAGFCQGTADSNEIDVYGRRARLSFSPYRGDSLVVQLVSDAGGEGPALASTVWRGGSARYRPSCARREPEATTSTRTVASGSAS